MSPRLGRHEAGLGRLSLARTVRKRPVSMEAAREEANSNLRRAIVATLKRHSRQRQCKAFLRQEAKSWPANKDIIEWVKKAA